ncbi:hypothetical protein HRbin02_01058 [Candidatus Calditenuaceae archaeon HR02]|nr:hypothetical protein HRbin02_01058 [Candidatus Calditenuaceae archaeon HR02]
MELDIIYSPVFWLVLNILVAFGILKLRKSLSAASKSSVEEFVEGPFWRLERALSMEVTSERQKEYLKNCINIFIQLLVERKLLEIKPSSTVREIFQAIDRREALELVELYEAVRFGQNILSEEELRVFKTSIRLLARMVIH